MLQFPSFLLLAGLAAAHTWPEQLQVIGPDGTYTGNHGYIRAYTPRSDPDFSDDKNVYLLPPNESGRIRIDSSDLACPPQQQSGNSYSSDYPMLNVQPGDHVAIKYLENGHVTQPELLPGKPKDGGSVFVYFMNSLEDGQTLENILRMSANASLAEGRLVGSGNYDDGRCYQINDASSISLERQQQFPNPVEGQPGVNTERWCEMDAQIPTDAPSSGTLSGIWVWAWPTEGEGAKDEYYTGCFDVALGQTSQSADTPLAVQDPNMAALDGYQRRRADQPNPSFFLSTADMTTKKRSTEGWRKLIQKRMEGGLLKRRMEASGFTMPMQ
jgi:hypothetical protein